MPRPVCPRNEEVLIGCVKRYPCLYDRQIGTAGNTELKSELWQDIGSVAGLSGINAKRTWAQLRQRYILRRLKNMKMTKFDRQMSFLDGVIGWMKNDSVGASNVQTTNTTPLPRKRAKLSPAVSPFSSAHTKCDSKASDVVAEQKSIPQSSDAFDTFFLSFANIAKLMPPKSRKELMKEFQDVVLDKVKQLRKQKNEQQQPSAGQTTQNASNRSEATNPKTAASLSKASVALAQDIPLDLRLDN